MDQMLTDLETVLSSLRLYYYGSAFLLVVLTAFAISSHLKIKDLEKKVDDMLEGLHVIANRQKEGIRDEQCDREHGGGI